MGGEGAGWSSRVDVGKESHYKTFPEGCGRRNRRVKFTMVDIGPKGEGNGVQEVNMK